MAGSWDPATDRANRLFCRWVVEQGVAHNLVLNAQRLTATEPCVALNRGSQESGGRMQRAFPNART